jgi:hypothetical protein
MFSTADLRTATLSSDECHEIGAMEVAPYRQMSFPHLLLRDLNIFVSIVKIGKGKAVLLLRGVNQITFTPVP